jgi:hypothetical protein
LLFDEKVLHNKERLQMQVSFDDEIRPTCGKSTEQPRLSPQVEGECLAQIGEHAAALTKRSNDASKRVIHEQDAAGGTCHVCAPPHRQPCMKTKFWVLKF